MRGAGIISSRNRREQILRVARLHYIDGLEQNQVAKREGISRTTVSRLLATARDEGLVSITVNDHLEDVQTLAQSLQEAYPQVTFTVAATDQDGQDNRAFKVAKLVASHLDQLIKSGDIIGMGRGHDLLRVADLIEPKDVRDVAVLLLSGIFTDPNYQTYAQQAAAQFAVAYRTQSQLLPLPIILDDVQRKEIIEQEPHIRYVEKLGRVSNVALFTFNPVDQNCFLANDAYFNRDEQQLLTKNAVGDVLAHFIDQNGQLVAPKVDQRVVSIPLENLRYKEHAIGLVDDKTQVPTLLAALRGGYVNEVFLDQQSAHALLEK